MKIDQFNATFDEFEIAQIQQIAKSTSPPTKDFSPRIIKVENADPYFNEGEVSNNAIKNALLKAESIQNNLISDDSFLVQYFKKRGDSQSFKMDSPYARGSFSTVYVVFPPYPIRVNQETFKVPALASLIFPLGSEIHVDRLGPKNTDNVLFQCSGKVIDENGKMIAACMRKDIVKPRIKTINKELTVFRFDDVICNLSIHNPIIHGADKAIQTKEWTTDGRIFGGHFEDCRYAFFGLGGHNLDFYDNSFLTCDSAIYCVNAQNLHIKNNIFSQENSTDKPDKPIAVTVQGKNIFVDNNTFRDHVEVFRANVYNGSFSNNNISFSSGYESKLKEGWLAKLYKYGIFGGTDWQAYAGMKPNCDIDSNRVDVDGNPNSVPLDAILYQSGVTTDFVLNRGPAVGYLKGRVML